MRTFKGNNFNLIYLEILYELLHKPENIIENRKCSILHEYTLSTIVLTDLDNCYAYYRNMNFKYLVGELLFYLKGENKLKNILPYSKFWEKVSDDGVNLNSCYGYYIWKMEIFSSMFNNPLQVGNQFDYCLRNLQNNKHSKKAVMTIYEGSKHSYETNDNPCTMYLQFLIRNDKLNMIVNMRSNDIFFGLPYDLPFFIFVLKMLYWDLKRFYSNLKLGYYYHTSNSLHLYEKDFDKVKKVLNNPHTDIEIPKIDETFFDHLQEFMNIEYTLNTSSLHPFIEWSRQQLRNKEDENSIYERFMKEAYVASKQSNCLKKSVGCVFVKQNGDLIISGWGGRSDKQGKCKYCHREANEIFTQDGCNSIHSELNAILRAGRAGYMKFLEGSNVYITHGPCDQCMKLLIDVGIYSIYYDISYKTDFTKYEGLIKVYEKTRRII